MTTILLVDDNQQNLYLLSALLTGHGFSVISAKDGAEALEVARTTSPQLVISDLLMPKMDGFTLLRHWKADDRLRPIPFIVYTATYTDPADEQFVKDLGADRFVIKPQKPEEIYRIIREVIAEYRIPDRSAAQPALSETEILQLHNEALFRKLEKKVDQLETELARQKETGEEIRLANRKLALMTEITYQDIQNKVTALRGFTDLLREQSPDPESIALVNRQVEILETIQNLIGKVKEYQKMGQNQSCWSGIEEIIRMQMSLQSKKDAVDLVCDLHGLEIFADPLISRVFFNLIQNAIRHGGGVTCIRFSCRMVPGGIRLLCEDNGSGIPAGQKEKIFERVPGGEGKFGLFFVREFLSMSGMTIEETGTPGNGARFGIFIPDGLYRVPA